MGSRNIRPTLIPIQDRATVLSSWKEIAVYLHTSVRTVQRWEQAEQLPVHRHEHAAGGTVYAHAQELDDWLAARSRVPGVSTAERRPSPWRRQGWAIGAAVVAMFGLLGAWALLSLGNRAPVESLAVLPFVNEGGDPDTEYLSEGLPESVTRGLSQLEGFRVKVIAQSAVMRMNGQTRDAQRAGRLLNAAAVLTGRVTQRGDRLSVSVELIKVDDNTQIWGERFDRKLVDVLLLQEQIAREIASRLHLRLTDMERAKVVRQPTANPEAHRHYLRGRYHWNRRTEGGLHQAIEYFQQAIAGDPAYGLAYAGLAESYAVLSYYSQVPPREPAAKSIAAARKALELEPGLSEAWNALAHMESDYQWQWEIAERHFRRALELDGNNATAHHWFSEHLAAMGRFREERVEMARAAELDPLSPVISNNLGHAYYFTGRYEEAEAIHRKAAVEYPSLGNANQDLGKLYLVQGRYGEAIAEFQRMHELGGAFIHMGLLGMAYGLSGDRARAKEIQRNLLGGGRQGYVSPYVMAFVSLGLGEREDALGWLEKAEEERSQTLRWISVEPLFDTLRNEPRFRSILKRMDLPVLAPSDRHE